MSSAARPDISAKDDMVMCACTVGAGAPSSMGSCDGVGFELPGADVPVDDGPAPQPADMSAIENAQPIVPKALRFTRAGVSLSFLTHASDNLPQPQTAKIVSNFAIANWNGGPPRH